MRKRTIIFVNFVLVIAALSALGTGYLFKSSMNSKTAKMADLVRSQALMVKQRGQQLEKLASKLSALPDQKSLKPYVDEVKSNALAMEQYADGLMQKMQVGNPQRAMTEMAAVNPLSPEDINRIKSKDKQIEEIQKSNQNLNTIIADLEKKLFLCRTRPNPGSKPDSESD
jgi:hypothetical protein